jgi:DNA-binding transcriptional regulator GbsR (MarR family)
LYALLKRAPPLSATQLPAATGKSQASISLALKRLGEQVVKLGAARSTRIGYWLLAAGEQ